MEPSNDSTEVLSAGRGEPVCAAAHIAHANGESGEAVETVHQKTTISELADDAGSPPAEKTLKPSNASTEALSAEGRELVCPDACLEGTHKGSSEATEAVCQATITEE